jgi:glycerol-3-phosphate cytidylyltransferase
MFVGSDWKYSEAWNNFEKQFSSLGVKIIYLPHTDNISTTILVEYIKNSYKI